MKNKKTKKIHLVLWLRVMEIMAILAILMIGLRFYFYPVPPAILFYI